MFAIFALLLAFAVPSGAESAEETIAEGEKYLMREWVPTLASTWVEYKKTGDLSLLKEEEMNRIALVAMMNAELAERKGRFIARIADYAWLETTQRRLPSSADLKADPYAADRARTLEEVCRLFRKELDALDPSICKTLLQYARRQTP